MQTNWTFGLNVILWSTWRSLFLTLARLIEGRALAGYDGPIGAFVVEVAIMAASVSRACLNLSRKSAELGFLGIYRDLKTLSPASARNFECVRRYSSAKNAEEELSEFDLQDEVIKPCKILFMCEITWN